MQRAATALRGALTGRSAISPAVMRVARAVAVFPATNSPTKVRQGHGIVSGRDPKPGGWLLPAVVSFKATLRVPAGRNPGDILLVAISRRGFDRLGQDEFTLAESVDISPGPVGRNSPIKLGTDLVAYTRYRIAFAGITIEQLEISEDVEANKRLYGSEARLNDVLFGRIRTGPPNAMAWPGTIEAYFREMK